MFVEHDDDRVRSVGQVLKDFLPHVESLQAKGGVDLLGVPTGFRVIDEWTAGMKKDEMWIIGASTSVGKTALALDIALNGADDGVLYYSLEMSAEVMVARLLARLTDIPPMRIRLGKITKDELRFVKDAAATLQATKIAVIDRSFTSAELCEHAKRMAERIDVGLVVVDYAQILRDPNEFGNVQRVNEISSNIRNLARPNAIDAPVLLLSQLSRAATGREDKTPVITDLKDSSQLEQDSEVVLLPYRPYVEDRIRGADPKDVETDAMIIVAKNRNGPVGATRAHFYPKQMRWAQTEPKAVDPRPIAQLTRKAA